MNSVHSGTDGQRVAGYCTNRRVFAVSNRRTVALEARAAPVPTSLGLNGSEARDPNGTVSLPDALLLEEA